MTRRPIPRALAARLEADRLAAMRQLWSDTPPNRRRRAFR